MDSEDKKNTGDSKTGTTADKLATSLSSIAPFERKPERKDGSGVRKLPSPSPHEGSTVKYISDDDVSSETISIKRSSLLKDHEKRIELPGEKKEESATEETPSKRQVKIFCYNCSQKLDLTELEPFGRIECPSCSAQLIVPKWFDNYLLEEPGGVGGMATVYRALDLTLDREVAIKVLSPDVAVKIERKKLFLHEARTAATLNHYAVLPIYTCGEFEEQPYIVMQFMEGGSLDRKLEQMGAEKIPVGDVVKWISDVAEGLDNARRHGIIHHDIKPANLMLDRDGNVKIGDFGIAQAIRNFESKDIDEITRLWSSPHFVSPEKVSSGKEDHRGDIYSLGATFYNIITAHTPFDLDDINQLVSFKLNNDPPDPRKHRIEIPESIAHLIVSMMARTPELRPSYRDIITLLTSFVRKSEIMDKKIKQTKKKQSDKIPVLPRKNPSAPSTPHGAIPTPAIDSHKKSYGAMIALSIIAAIFIFAICYMMKQDPVKTSDPTPVQSHPSPVANYEDYHQNITEMLKKGYCKEALLIAEKRITDASSPIEARLQAAVQLAFATYLKNDGNARNICQIAAEQLSVAGANERSPLLAIVKYLGSPNVSSETLLSQVSGRSEEKLLAVIAIFLKTLYDKSGEIEVLRTSKNLGIISQEAKPEFWGSAFRDRIQIWQEWINYGSGKPEGLEPLIKENKYNPKAEIKPKTSNVAATREQDPWKTQAVKSRSDVDLSSLSVGWLEKNRKFASQRPRPANFDFTDDMVNSYLGSLDKDRAATEAARLQIIRSIKRNLCACMMRMNYENSEIILKGGKKFTGDVKANDKYLSIRLKNGNHQRLSWSEIDFMQMVKFLEYFAKIRESAFGGETDSESQRSYDSAMEYLRIGLLADWYGNYSVAVEYTRKAVSMNPKVEPEAIKYILY